MSKNEDNTKVDDKSSSGVENICNTAIDDISNAHIPPELLEIENEEVFEPIEKPEDKPAEIFDKEIHAVDKDGQPSRTKTGKLRKKRGVSVVAVKEKQKEAQEKQAKKLGSLKAAHGASTLFFTSAQGVFGEEWQPQEIEGLGNEKTELTNSFHAYFEAKEIDDFPVGVALALSMVMIAGRRMDKPQTKSTMKVIKEKLIISIYNLKGKIKNGSYFSSGKNGKRKNSVIKTNSEKSNVAGGERSSA